LKRVWEQEYDGWRKRPLDSAEYAYLWADGINVDARLEEQRSCILVAVGANFEEHKELLALHDGYRESA
jgi:putative transposase